MITGLALALDTTRDTLMDYEGKDEFSDTIKKPSLKLNVRMNCVISSGEMREIFLR